MLTPLVQTIIFKKFIVKQLIQVFYDVRPVKSNSLEKMINFHYTEK